MLDNKLLKLQRKKLQRQILYLRSELEETQIIFQECLGDFESEFGKYFRDNINKKNKNESMDPVEFDIPEKDVNIVFRMIAQKTHPDKLIKEDISSPSYKSKVNMYKEAQRSVKNKDWSRVVEIAMELDIDVSWVKKDDSEYLVESVKKLTNKINQLKSTYAWKWGNAPDQEREIVKKMILQSLGLAVSVDDIIKEKENGK